MTGTLLLGVLGSGMRGLAELCHDAGVEVIGSDIILNQEDTSKNTELTLNLPCRTLIPQNLEAINRLRPKRIIYSTAVEQLAFHLKKIFDCDLSHRFEAVLDLLRNKSKIIISGSHGKSSTTAIIAHILDESFGCSFYIGAKFKKYHRYAVLNPDSEFAVIEADESDGSFLRATGGHTLITNVDYEHMDFWLNPKILQLAFKSWGMCNTSFEFGSEFQEINDSHERGCLDRYRIKGFSTEFEFRLNGKRLFGVIPFPGKHFAINAINAFNVCLRLGVDVVEALSALTRYQGISRRMEILSQEPLIITDYAHHPTEVKMLVDSVKKFNGSCEEKREICAFYQPHRISRTKQTFKEHTTVFDSIDRVFILPVFEPLKSESFLGPEIPREIICRELALELANSIKCRNVMFVEDFEERLAAEMEDANKIILLIGAGDIDERARRVIG